MANRESYDVIEIEPPETFTAGVIHLYTREFYRDVAARLADDGVFLQWIPLGEGSLDEEKMLLRSFVDVFPHATAWQQLFRDGQILLIGSKTPLTIDYRLLGEKMRRPRVRRDLELMGVDGPDRLLSMFVFDSSALADFVGDVPPVTDDRTVLDFSMPRFIGSGFGTGSFSPLAPIADAGGRVRPFDVAQERGLMYHGLRRSVVPQLTNLGGEDPRTVERRIAEQERPLMARGPRPIPEAAWRRW
jgi:hypothetical protein